MVTAVTGIGLAVETPRLYGGLRKHEPESVTVGISGLTDAGHPGHMTAHTAAEGMNAVHRAVLYGSVTAFAKPVFKQPRLGADGQKQIGGIHVGGDVGPALVHAVAGGTDHADFGMFTLLPVQILLVAVFGFSTGPEVFGIVTIGRADFLEIQTQVGLALVGLVIHRECVFSGLVPTPGVTGSAYLSG